MLTLVICPGIHDPLLTQQFVEGLQLGEMPGLKVVTFPASGIGAISSADISQFLWRQVGDPWRSSELLFISFSAGVVGAIGAAWAWQGFGGKVKALIAIDGWGVPLVGFFPIHRVSHDYFTHWSSALLGAGSDSFYADPGVEHLTLWRSPQTVFGWQQTGGSQKIRTTASEFLKQAIARYESSSSV
ncbi:MAG: hypothetical protein F6K32_18500 [Desertifilum sp. SIO1I2]|nr:hypothetical protein [Desertifilum sp. SIO1I2]